MIPILEEAFIAAGVTERSSWKAARNSTLITIEIETEAVRRENTLSQFQPPPPHQHEPVSTDALHASALKGGAALVEVDSVESQREFKLPNDPQGDDEDDELDLEEKDAVDTEARRAVIAYGWTGGVQ